jgi:hypothetical protein
MIPFSFVLLHSRPVLGFHRFYLLDEIWSDSNVTDVTADIKAVESRLL